MRHTIFGESHGPAIGVVLEQVPAGIELDQQEIAREMARRAPGNSPLSTARKEADIPNILSGVFQGKTTGCLLYTSFGKMGHSERWNPGVAKNIPGEKLMPLFESGAEYFK